MAPPAAAARHEVAEETEPGFFREGRLHGGVVTCATNVCTTNSYAARTVCQSRSCEKNSCSNLVCEKDQCTEQSCSQHKCDSHSAALSDIVSELQANWDSAFVRELRVQFGADSTTALAQAVTSFVQRNGYRAR